MLDLIETGRREFHATLERFEAGPAVRARLQAGPMRRRAPQAPLRIAAQLHLRRIADRGLGVSP